LDSIRLSALIFVKLRPVHPSKKFRSSVLAWPAWRRVLFVLPVVLLLWLAVVWAGGEAAPW